MISFWRIFWLETLALVRTKTAALLTLLALAWMFAMPFVLKGDGTAAGAREMYLHYALGGVVALLVVALVACATGSIARERAAHRLQLTLVRPVRYAAIAAAKMLAHVVLGAVVLTLATLVLCLRVDLAVPCNHVLKPVLPSPREEARAMYDAYMADPETPAEVKRARKSVVLRLLENRAIDHYQTIPTNAVVSWRFEPTAPGAGLNVRLRFTNRFEMRQDVRGVFHFGALTGVVNHVTQAVMTLPLEGDAVSSQEPVTTLTFHNAGKYPLMLRPRKDLDLLEPADALGWNLLRTWGELVAMLALLIAFGTVLGATLGRPVALFVAIVTLILGEMSPAVIQQYPDELETKTLDRIGLHLTRFAAEVTHPVSSLSPLARFAADECVEPREVVRVVALDFLLVPLLFAVLAGLALPRKTSS